MADETPHLTRPPIIEVVCGVVFEPIDELDALALGIYWDERAKDYPNKSLQLALGDQTFMAPPSMFPMRAVFVTEDNQFVLQLQRDRFFVNWRKRGHVYPRFSGSDGVLQRTRVEFEKFQAFVARRFNKPLVVKHVDMSKIDLLSRGTEWDNLHELATMLPLSGVFETVQDAQSREFNLTFVEHGAVGDMTLNMATAVGPEGPTGVRVESRIVCESNVDSLWKTFETANLLLNRVFFRLFSPSGVAKLKGLK